MIMPDDDLTCKDKHKRLCGYFAMYDVSEDAEIARGVTLASLTNSEQILLFQCDDTINILEASSIPVTPGTLCAYKDEGEFDLEIEYTPVATCRFPTKEELEWYNKRETV